MKSSIAFGIFAAAVLLVLFLLSSSGKKAALIPADGIHKNVTADPGCRECHAPGRVSPLKPAHPPKEQCLICHKAKSVRG